MASHDEEDLMISISRQGLEQAVKAVGSGGPPVCIATEVAASIEGMGDVERDLKEIAARYSCDLLPSHILHRGDLVPAHLFIKET